MNVASAWTTSDRVPDPFVHEALLYDGPASFLDGAMKFIYEGFSFDEPIAVAAPPRNVALLRERLGAFADRVRFIDMTAAGRNPGPILPLGLPKFMEQPARRPGRSVR